MLQSNGLLFHSQELRVEQWSEHFRERFSCSTAIVGLLFMPVSKTMWADTSPVSEMGVIRVICLTKSIRHLDQIGCLHPSSRMVAKS